MKLKPKKTLGILGGMGAVASSQWYKTINDILAKKYQVRNDSDYPQMYIHNLSMDGWNEKGIEDEKAVKISLLAGIEKMNLLEPDYIIIACNTAHIFFDELQNASTGEIISLIDTCADYLKKVECRRVGILSSQVTKKYKLYSNALDKNGIKNFPLDSVWQPYINNVIQRILSGTFTPKQKEKLDILIEQFTRYHQLDSIIIGCTELPLAIFKDTNHSLHGQCCSYPRMFDSGLILIEEVLKKIYK